MLSYRKRLLPTNLLIAVVAAVVTLGSWNSLIAGSIITTGPSDSLLTNDSAGNIGARIRWGDNGWEGAISRGGSAVGLPALNPIGTPAWVVGQAYDFQVSWNASTGTMGLSVDFDGGGFGTGESVSHIFTDRIGFGYYGLQIFGNQSGSTATSTITNLSINGDAQSNLAPTANSTITQQFKDSANALLTNITLNGKITFLSPGTTDERPSWTFTLLGNAPVPPPIPEPATVSAMLAGLAGLLMARRRTAKS